MYSRHFQARSNPASKGILYTFKPIGAHLFSTLGLLFASLIIPSRPHSSTARPSTLFFSHSFFIRTRTLTAVFCFGFGRLGLRCAFFPSPSFSTRHTHLCGPHDRTHHPQISPRPRHTPHFLTAHRSCILHLFSAHPLSLTIPSLHSH